MMAAFRVPGGSRGDFHAIVTTLARIVSAMNVSNSGNSTILMHVRRGGSCGQYRPSAWPEYRRPLGPRTRFASSSRASRPGARPESASASASSLASSLAASSSASGAPPSPVQSEESSRSPVPAGSSASGTCGVLPLARGCGAAAGGAPPLRAVEVCIYVLFSAGDVPGTLVSIRGLVSTASVTATTVLVPSMATEPTVWTSPPTALE